MLQQKVVRAIYHDGTLQLLEPVDLSDGIEIEVTLPAHGVAVRVAQGPAFPTRLPPPGDFRPGAGITRRGEGMHWPILRPSMMSVALDTSVLIGVLDVRDVWHSAALRLYDALIAAQLSLVYFDCVLAEASSTLARRLREQRRIQEFMPLLDRLMMEFPPEMLTWIFPDIPRLYGADAPVSGRIELQ